MTEGEAARPRHAGLLALVLVVAGFAYGWREQSVPLEPYYAAAVRAMAGSWHDFAFGAFDPAGTVTLDKLPGAFWLQALSVRVFG
jgi:4-amino-4-deoxy-L-arabinose transferase-like glycosyltransferase